MQNSTGINTAVGYSALFNTTANDNVAAGSFLRTNTLGTGNTSIGAASLRNNTLGYLNVAVGHFPIIVILRGINNVAIGEGISLRSNTHDQLYTAIGNFVFYMEIPQELIIQPLNQALGNNTTGTQNTVQELMHFCKIPRL